MSSFIEYLWDQIDLERGREERVDLLMGDWISVTFESREYPRNKWEIKGIHHEKKCEVAAVLPDPRFECGARPSSADGNKHH